MAVINWVSHLACYSILILTTNAQREDSRGPQTFYNDQNPTHQDYSGSDSGRAPPPAILTHKQAVSNDGVFNYVFAADNGLKQGESISPDGSRTGAYEYIDSNGKTISVKYMAGKDGFRIIEGDHVPLQPKPFKPIAEYQPPEYRKDLGSEGQAEPRQQEQYVQEGNRFNKPRERFEERQRKAQRYTSQDYVKPKQALFNPNQEQFQQQRHQERLQSPARPGQAGPGQARPAKPSRAMLYNVEQRHSINYRKYQDNGQLVGAAENGQDGGAAPATRHFEGGYNFEFKG